MILSNLNFPFDYIILTIIFLIIFFSFWKGFIQSILSLLTWVGSILITIYTYEILSEFFISLLLKINIFNRLEYLTNIGSIILSIPIIFFICLFILKKLRIFISSDLDKGFLGLFFDKIFGLIYGMIFSYIIISAGLILLERFNLEEINLLINNHSKIILYINNINNEYIFLINNTQNN